MTRRTFFGWLAGGLGAMACGELPSFPAESLPFIGTPGTIDVSGPFEVTYFSITPEGITILNKEIIDKTIQMLAPPEVEGFVGFYEQEKNNAHS